MGLKRDFDRTLGADDDKISSRGDGEDTGKADKNDDVADDCENVKRSGKGKGQK